MTIRVVLFVTKTLKNSIFFRFTANVYIKLVLYVEKFECLILQSAISTIKTTKNDFNDFNALKSLSMAISYSGATPSKTSKF
jgi:hypothetical protein